MVKVGELVYHNGSGHYHLEGLLNARLLYATPRTADSVGMGWDQRISISNELFQSIDPQIQPEGYQFQVNSCILGVGSRI